MLPACQTIKWNAAKSTVCERVQGSLFPGEIGQRTFWGPQLLKERKEWELVNADPSSGESIKTGDRAVRIQRIIIGIETAQLEAPFHFFTLFSELHYNIKSGDLRRWNTGVHGNLVKVEIEASCFRVPGTGFLPDTLYVAETKRPFRGARNLKRAVV